MKQSSTGQFIKANLPFLLPYFLFLLLAGYVITVYPKPPIHIYINDHTYGMADTFFRLITNLGDGFTVAILVLIFLFIRFRFGIQLALSGIFAGFFTQVLKRTLFQDMERPKNFFEGIHQLHLIPGVENYGGHTFPSGHSASAFALYFSLALFTENKILKALLFLLAITVAFSRVYLSQHFLNDIYAGSLFGIAACLLARYLILHARPFAGAAWIDKSFLTMNSNKA
ncbi:MAG: phosphatase PAP2 family protein [Bacteroidia bacterium]